MNKYAYTLYVTTAPLWYAAALTNVIHTEITFYPRRELHCWKKMEYKVLILFDDFSPNFTRSISIYSAKDLERLKG